MKVCVVLCAASSSIGSSAAEGITVKIITCLVDHQHATHLLVMSSPDAMR